MNSLQIFNSSEFGEIRTVEIDGKPYFVANDVAKALGYSTPKDAVTRHCKGALKRRCLTDGGEQEMKVIPEGDVYRLVVRSQLPSAERFETWVFDEVLPSIRKTGTYSMVDRSQLSPQLQLMNMLVESMNKQEIEQKRQAEQLRAVETTVTNMKEIFVEPVRDWKDEINSMVREISIKSGIEYQALYTQLYSELETTAHCSLKRLQENKRARMEKAGNTKTAIKEATTKIAIVYEKPQLKAIFENIVKRYAMRYCA